MLYGEVCARRKIIQALALQLVLRHLSLVSESSALWIDSSGEFSTERVGLMLEQMNGPV